MSPADAQTRADHSISGRHPVIILHTLRMVANSLLRYASFVSWPDCIILILTPLFGMYGLLTTPLLRATLIWSFFLGFVTNLGITAGYHRLWSHRSYEASAPLRILLLLAGTGAVQGSVFWWVRGHRVHHRYLDTEQDPYNATKGLFWSHLGWMLLRREQKIAKTDMGDLRNDALVQWQHRYYPSLAVVFGYVLPCLIAGYGWGDFRGGWVYASLLRMTIVHHATFSVNSLAHTFGRFTYDDENTPRDHFLVALVTLGEGYHNFHHSFPTDYRNAVRWYQYDPTKWFIAFCKYIGLASHLRVFPENEIVKGSLSMQLKELKAVQDSIQWPIESRHLPVVEWTTYVLRSKETPLVLVSGFIHDVSSFMNNHPGGRAILATYIGQDATASFHGGVYKHSHAAQNLLAMFRIGVLAGGVEHVKAWSPAELRRIVERTEAVRRGSKKR